MVHYVACAKKDSHIFINVVLGPVHSITSILFEIRPANTVPSICCRTLNFARLAEAVGRCSTTSGEHKVGYCCSKTYHRVLSDANTEGISTQSTLQAIGT